MKVNDYVNMMLAMMGIDEKNYDGLVFNLPTLVAHDGFNISVQCSSLHYSGSENGYRKFGRQWKTLEWGYPSHPISAEIFGGLADDDDETMHSCDMVEIEHLEKLFEEHGGIDIEATLSNANSVLKDYFEKVCRTQLSTHKI